MKQLTYITSFVKNNKWLVWLVVFGSTTWSLTMVKSGWVYDYGMGFWGPNGHDGIWHIAVIESLVRGSWGMPVFAGTQLQNYHIGFDLLVAIIHKITFIPVSTLYFQVLPVVLAVGIGIACYRFVFAWKKSKVAALWATFFVYFGSGLGWLVTYLRNGELGGESMFWSQQSVSTLINPPFALSLLLIFLGLERLVRIVNTKKNVFESVDAFLSFVKESIEKRKISFPQSQKVNLVVITFLFGLLIFVKVYAGLLILGGLLVAGMYETLIKRRGILILRIFVSVLVVSLLLFLPMNSASGSVIQWKPFWFLETMMQLSDRLNWPVFGDAGINYRLGNIWWKAIPAYIIAFIVFWYGNVGTRLFGEVYLAKRILNKTIDYMDVLLVSIIVAGILIPTFFVQSGTPWNTIQFMYYSLVFSGVFAGVAVSEILGNKRQPIQVLLGGMLVLLTIPTTYSTLMHHYLPARPPAKVSQEELNALRFLARQPEGVVLTYLYDADTARAAVSNPPRPLYLYESTAYVSALSKHDVYLEDEVNLNITGYDWPSRREMVEEFLHTNDINEARSFLSRNNISYIYWIKGQRALLGEEQLGIEKLFENEEVNVYRVN